MSLGDAFVESDRLYRDQVMTSTWGHLAPKHGQRYFAHLIWSYSEFGDYTLIKSDIRVGDEVLPDSPWICQDMNDFISQNPDAQVHGEVYQFDGIYVWSDEFGRGRFEGTTSACEIVRKDYQTWKQ